MNDDELKIPEKTPPTDDELLALCEKASPAPWHHTGAGNVYDSCRPRPHVAATSLSLDDAQFIAAAREAIPRLIEEKRALEPYKAMIHALAAIDNGRPLMALTERLDDHPEDYEGPCLCALCRSYA